jgi:hypothetical protein
MPANAPASRSHSLARRPWSDQRKPCCYPHVIEKLRAIFFVGVRAVVIPLSTANRKAHPIRAPIAAANAL